MDAIRQLGVAVYTTIVRAIGSHGCVIACEGAAMADHFFSPWRVDGACFQRKIPAGLANGDQYILANVALPLHHYALGARLRGGGEGEEVGAYRQLPQVELLRDARNRRRKNRSARHVVNAQFGTRC